MNRGYQFDFSSRGEAMFDVSARERKAATMVAVIADASPTELSSLTALNVGGSTGIIDNYLARHFRHVTGVDLDARAIEHAIAAFKRDNLQFRVADAMNLPFPAEQFDVVFCTHVYEHVPDAGRLFDEIHRVLKSNGLCYFAANNRFKFLEPHYNLPLLSVVPRPLAHVYVRLARKAPFYYEKHLSLWGLKAIVKKFDRLDYTAKLIQDPVRYRVDYMLRPGSLKARLASVVVRYLYGLSPAYIWVLRKRG